MIKIPMKQLHIMFFYVCYQSFFLSTINNSYSFYNSFTMHILIIHDTIVCIFNAYSIHVGTLTRNISTRLRIVLGLKNPALTMKRCTFASYCLERQLYDECKQLFTIYNTRSVSAVRGGNIFFYIKQSLFRHNAISVRPKSHCANTNNAS